MLECKERWRGLEKSEKLSNRGNRKLPLVSWEWHQKGFAPLNVPKRKTPAGKPGHMSLFLVALIRMFFERMDVSCDGQATVQYFRNEKQMTERKYIIKSVAHDHCRSRRLSTPSNCRTSVQSFSTLGNDIGSAQWTDGDGTRTLRMIDQVSRDIAVREAISKQQRLAADAKAACS